MVLFVVKDRLSIYSPRDQMVQPALNLDPQPSCHVAILSYLAHAGKLAGLTPPADPSDPSC